jgi:molecular chaperone GrpE (heat shock protein)
MAYTQEQIEWLHDHGKMPDWIYYQVNGKSAQENYNEQHKKILERYRAREEEARRQAEQKKAEAELEKEIEAKVEKTVEKVLEDLLKGFK